MPKLYVVLLKRAADLYKTIMDLAKKTKGYFPSGLEKHFELQYNLLSLQTLHYYGMQLMENSETNGGNLYKLGGRIDVSMEVLIESRTYVWRRKSFSTASTLNTVTSCKLAMY